MHDQTDHAAGQNDRGWYYDRDGQSVGPFAVQELATLAKAGLIRPETVLIGQDGQRLPAGQLIAFGTSSIPAPAPATAATADAIVQAAVMDEPTAAPSTASLPLPPPDAPVNPKPFPPPPIPPDARPASTSVNRVVPSITPVSNAQDADADRLVAWNRLREIARWRRWSLLWFIAPLAVVFVAPIVAAIFAGDKSAAITAAPSGRGSAVFVVLMIVFGGGWAAVWFWLSHNLRRALGPTSDLNTILDYWILGYLDWRANSVLRKANIQMRLLGPGLPEQPPVWFGRPQGQTPFTAVARPEPPAPSSRLTRWRGKALRRAGWSFLTGVGLFILVGVVDPEAHGWLQLVLVVAWLAIACAVLSLLTFVLFSLMGLFTNRR